MIPQPVLQPTNHQPTKTNTEPKVNIRKKSTAIPETEIASELMQTQLESMDTEPPTIEEKKVDHEQNTMTPTPTPTPTLT
ncbi:hypothetical protein M1146_06100, partial [Patescibacteria group bacterium]|nr:hypothetical protein [Patescibacteria group bacterium]